MTPRDAAAARWSGRRVAPSRHLAAASRSGPQRPPLIAGLAGVPQILPNIHPQLVASVVPFLEPGEEVWAVYPARRRSLVATGTRLFLVGPSGAMAHPLHEFELMRRPRPSLVLLHWRAGGALRIALNPLDEHGIQALRVIGLLVARVVHPHPRIKEAPAPARPESSARHPLATHRYALRMERMPAVTTNGGWSNRWARADAAPTEHRANPLARHAYRLGPTLAPRRC
jgi:hypothetical protein